MRVIADFARDHCASASSITLGVADATLVGDLNVAAEWSGLSLHHAAGESLARSAPARLLLAVAEFLEYPRFANFATLLRHPDLERAVVRSAQADLAREEWLALLDTYLAQHLHADADGTWLGDDQQQNRLKGLWATVHHILSPLSGQPNNPADAARPSNQWCQGALDVLANVYGIDDAEAGPVNDDGDREQAAPRPGPPDLRAIDECLELRDVIAEIAFAAPALQPHVTAPQALRMMLNEARSAGRSDDRQANQVEALGWLELHLDPAPMLVIAGVNDGRVPESLTADAFLPEGLRAQLGLMHNARRYARDAYLLQAIVRSRKPEHLRLIVGRRDTLGEPLTPSRLLLACDDQSLARRVSRFARDLSGQPMPPPIGLCAMNSPGSRFVVPRLELPLAAPKAMSVTEFGKYLRCPYRWALERLLWLKAFGHDEPELNPLTFGSLVHHTLSALAEDASIACSEDSEAIFRYLAHRLHELLRQQHGARPLPAILIQCARIEQRLRAFADFQAYSVREGWRIRHCEIDVDQAVSLDIPGDDGGPMPLRGKIDRIDENIRTNRWRVIDYKTGEAGDGPIKVHHHAAELPPPGREPEWHDLQLPLYHFIAAAADTLRLPADRMELGYVVLPRRADSAAWLTAAWTREHLQHGVNRARAIVREIRQAVVSAGFEHNREIDSPFDTFARICQTAAFGPLAVEADGESAFDIGGVEQ
jgi:hypothetical protein